MLKFGNLTMTSATEGAGRDGWSATPPIAGHWQRARRAVGGEKMPPAAKNVRDYNRQLLIAVSRIAVAPSCSSCSMIWITSLRFTIARTAHQPGCSRWLTVGEL